MSSACACAARRCCARRRTPLPPPPRPAATPCRARASGTDLIAAQAFIERAERNRREAALDLDRQDAEVAARRAALQAAARDRQVIDKLEERQRAEHNREWARRAQNALDEIALAVHRRGAAAA